MTPIPQPVTWRLPMPNSGKTSTGSEPLDVSIANMLTCMRRRTSLENTTNAMGLEGGMADPHGKY